METNEEDKNAYPEDARMRNSLCFNYLFCLYMCVCLELVRTKTPGKSHRKKKHAIKNTRVKRENGQPGKKISENFM